MARATCGFDACEEAVSRNRVGVTTGYCLDHQGEGNRRKRQVGERWVNGEGYVCVKLEDRIVFEHRHVMEESLGRKLVPGETVHHKNGVRTDNRPENLEVWFSQPAGQRVEDLVAYIVAYHLDKVFDQMSNPDTQHGEAHVA